MNVECLHRLVARWASLGVLVLSGLAAAAQTDGIFADFTTSLGSFTCALDYTNAPRTSANFIGLATGQRAWLDLPSGRARTNAFYNGLIFHRVIAGFMSQGGSPNGTGNDGPGYAFKDEFTSPWTFDSFGVVAMANSGPNSDGSQFFVTVAPYTSGNNTYSIFGKVVSGSNVVYAINHVATDANDKPLTDVVIQQVSIRRVGPAAQAFNINAQGLPVVTNLPLRLTNRASQVSLTFSNRQFADNRLYTSTNLNSWTGDLLGIEPAIPGTNTLYVAKDTPAKFFRMAQVQYPASTLAPKNLYNQVLALTLTTGGSGTITITFDAVGGGTFIFPPNPGGSVTGYVWTQDPYRGWLLIGLAGYPVLNLRCDFATGSSGTFTGNAYPSYPSSVGSFPVAGTFSLSGP